MIIYSNFKQTFAHVRYLIPNCKSQSSCVKFMRFIVSYIREPIVLFGYRKRNKLRRSISQTFSYQLILIGFYFSLNPYQL